ncbi:MAG TPA: NAD(P)-binding domain-containing protein, partial [Candidatus Caenarcaniphilales bacterium]
MGEAILSRLLIQGVYLPHQVLVSEPNRERLRFLAERYSIQVTSDNQAVAAATEVLLLAVKPQVFAAVASALTQTQLPEASLILSIL